MISSNNSGDNTTTNNDELLIIPLSKCNENDIVGMDRCRQENPFPLYNIGTLASTRVAYDIDAVQAIHEDVRVGVDSYKKHDDHDKLKYLKSDRDIADERFKALTKGLHHLVRVGEYEWDPSIYTELMSVNNGSINIIPWLLLCQSQAELYSLLNDTNRSGGSSNATRFDSYFSPMYWNRSVIDKRISILKEAIQRNVGNMKGKSGVPSTQLQCTAIQELNSYALGQLYIGLIQNLNVYNRDTVQTMEVLEEACRVLPLHLELRLMRVAQHRISLDVCVNKLCEMHVREMKHITDSYAYPCLHSCSHNSLSGTFVFANSKKHCNESYLVTSTFEPSDRLNIQMEYDLIMLLTDHVVNVELASGHTERGIATIQAILELNLILGVVLGHVSYAYTHSDLEKKKRYIMLEKEYEAFWEQEESRLGESEWDGSNLHGDCDGSGKSGKGDVDKICCKGFFNHMFPCHMIKRTGDVVGATVSIMTPTPTSSVLVEQILEIYPEWKLKNEHEKGTDSNIDIGPIIDSDIKAVSHGEHDVTAAHTIHRYSDSDTEVGDFSHGSESVNFVKNEEDTLQYSRIHGYKVAMGSDDASARYKSILKSIRLHSGSSNTTTSNKHVNDTGSNRNESAFVAGQDGSQFQHAMPSLNSRPTHMGKDQEIWDDYYTLGKVEGILSQLQWKPLKGSAEYDQDAMMEQPERVVVYDDIKMYMFPIVHSSSRETLISAMLGALGFILPHFNTIGNRSSASEGMGCVHESMWNGYITRSRSFMTKDPQHSHSILNTIPYPLECCPLMNSLVDGGNGGSTATMTLLRHHMEMGLFAYRVRQGEEPGQEHGVGESWIRSSCESGSESALGHFDSKLDLIIRLMEGIVGLYVHTHSHMRVGKNYELLSKLFVEQLLVGLMTLQAQRFLVNQHILSRLRVSCTSCNVNGNNSNSSKCSSIDAFINTRMDAYTSHYQSKCRHYIQVGEKINSFVVVERVIPPPPVYTGPEPGPSISISSRDISDVRVKQPGFGFGFGQHGSSGDVSPKTKNPASNTHLIPISAYQNVNLRVIVHFIYTEASLGHYSSSLKLCKKTIHAITPQVRTVPDRPPGGHLLIPGYLELFHCLIHLILLPGVSYDMTGISCTETPSGSNSKGNSKGNSNHSGVPIPISINGYRSFPIPTRAYPDDNNSSNNRSSCSTPSVRWFHDRLGEIRGLLYCCFNLPQIPATDPVGSGSDLSLSQLSPVLALNMKLKSTKKKREKNIVNASHSTTSSSSICDIQHMQTLGLLDTHIQSIYEDMVACSVSPYMRNNSGSDNGSETKSIQMPISVPVAFKKYACYTELVVLRIWYTLANHLTVLSARNGNYKDMGSMSSILSHDILNILEICNEYFKDAIETLVNLLQRLLIARATGILPSEETSRRIQSQNEKKKSEKTRTGRTRVCLDDVNLNRVAVDILLLRYGYDEGSNSSNNNIGGGSTNSPVSVVSLVVNAIKCLYHTQIQFFSILQIQFAPCNNFNPYPNYPNPNSDMKKETQTHSNHSLHFECLLNPNTLQHIHKRCVQKYCLEALHTKALVDFPGDSVLLNLLVVYEISSGGGGRPLRRTAPCGPSGVSVKSELNSNSSSDGIHINTRHAGYLNLLSYFTRLSSTVSSSNNIVRKMDIDSEIDSEIKNVGRNIQTHIVSSKSMKTHPLSNPNPNPGPSPGSPYPRRLLSNGTHYKPVETFYLFLVHLLHYDYEADRSRCVVEGGDLRGDLIRGGIGMHLNTNTDIKPNPIVSIGDTIDFSLTGCAIQPPSLQLQTYLSIEETVISRLLNVLSIYDIHIRQTQHSSNTIHGNICGDSSLLLMLWILDMKAGVCNARVCEMSIDTIATVTNNNNNNNNNGRGHNELKKTVAEQKRSVKRSVQRSVQLLKSISHFKTTLFQNLYNNPFCKQLWCQVFRSSESGIMSIGNEPNSKPNPNPNLNPNLIINNNPILYHEMNSLMNYSHLIKNKGICIRYQNKH